ncbi:glycosyltransferase [Micromonospora sp. DT44]|uniref:glycosyltransferase n=1 Tax=Micromonospora sp. DT44 TaxID=3393439 RepID=UPI003CF3D20E
MATLEKQPVELRPADIQPLDVIYFDAGGMFAHEGFTSGLLIIMREILRAFARQEMSVGVLSTVDIGRVRFPDTAAPGIRVRTEAGLDIIENVFSPDQARQVDQVHRDTTAILRRISPRFILMNSPAVFLSETDVLYRKWANETGAEIIHVVADHLFPTQRSHEPDMVSRLYKEMRNGAAISLTDSIKTKFDSASGMTSTRFKNPFVLDEVVASRPNTNISQRVGMVNLHPIKGRAVFHEIARRMPELDFLIAKNWPDVDEYGQSPSNVTVKDFFEEPRDFYQEIAVLLVPSLHEDGPARVVIEAMLNRIPVVANRIGSIPDAGEENVLLIEPPEILGFELNGDVLVPRLEQDSLDRCVSDYCGAIALAMSHAPSISSQVERAHAMASSYASDAQRTLECLVKNWIEVWNRAHGGRRVPL